MRLNVTCSYPAPVLALFLLAMAPVMTMAQLTVTPAQSASILAQKLTGQGVTILNPVLTCDLYAAGSFKATASTLGLDSGIMLTTGSAVDAAGDAYILASTKLGTSGDPQLASLARATTYDACRLEFDVIPKDDSLRFEYVFGSEEYNNATCGPYNDAFSFFISGPGISGQENMALVPGTQIPVAVNSINNGIPGPQGNISNCTSMGAGSPFTAFYVDNSAGSTLTYKGFTTVLRATHSVQPCATYHLRLTIADAGNGLYDSGVFLKAGSLRTAAYSITAAGSNGGTPPVIAPGCSNARITIKRSEKKPVAQSIHYIIGGNAVAGADFSPIADSAVISAGDSSVQFTLNAQQGPINGPKTVKLYLLDPYSCGQQRSIIDSTLVTLYDAPAIKIQLQDTTVCIGEALQLRISSTTGLHYNWSPANGLSAATTASPILRPMAAATYVLTATLPGSGCAPVTDSVHIGVMEGPEVRAHGAEACNGAPASIAGSASPAGSYAYSWTGPDGLVRSTDTLLHFTAARQEDSGLYVLQALGPLNACFGRDTVLLHVKPLPAAPAVVSPLELCVGGEVGPLRASGYTLLWYADSAAAGGSATVPKPSVAVKGAQHYYVSAHVGGCESRRARIDVHVYNCCGSDVVVPDAITPNGDGINDNFGILRGAEGVNADIRILNRWGQVVFRGSGTERWDGTQAGQPVPVGAYFYLITLDCRNGTRMLKKGELTIIR